MNFYQNIEPFVEYLFSIRKLKDYLSIDLLFPTKWSIPKNISETIETVAFKSENPEQKGISFVCQIDDNSLTTTISKITKIIKLNKEKELKEVLFKDTIDQLKKTFEKNDLETLKKLYFDFETDIENLDEDGDNGQESPTLELA